MLKGVYSEAWMEPIEQSQKPRRDLQIPVNRKTAGPEVMNTQRHGIERRVTSICAKGLWSGSSMIGLLMRKQQDKLVIRSSKDQASDLFYKVRWGKAIELLL